MKKEPDLDHNRANEDPRRHLPAMSVLLEHPRIKDLLLQSGRSLVIGAIRQALDRYRKELTPEDSAPDVDAIVAAASLFLLDVEGERLRPVINATGIILNPDLGRAVLPQRAVDALAGLNRSCNLQADIETGFRRKRNFVSERLLCELTGADGAAIVNNNAAATLLILTSLCQGKEVVVSRGHLIEVDRSYRLHDCIRQSGATRVEIGTTNKTHLRDYEGAITGQTGALMHVHTSNYRVMGFTSEVSILELAALKQGRDLLIISDLGCGALVDLAPYGFPHEPTVSGSIAAGADLVCFSGDKIIGGPQAGIIVGRGDLIGKIKKHPLARMLRTGKMTDVAIEQTLRLFLEPETLLETNPTLRMMTMSAERIRQRAVRLQEAIQSECRVADIRLVQGQSSACGAAPTIAPLRTFLLALRLPGISAEVLNLQLRRNEPPIIARIEDGDVLLDLRTVFEDEEPQILESLKKVITTN